MANNSKWDRDAVIKRYRADKDSLKLTSREMQIFELRFGITDGQSKTLEETGKAFGVTRERIRQIETKLLGKLRTLKLAEGSNPIRAARVFYS